MPVLASVESFLITPAARALKIKPTNANGNPARIEIPVGFAKYNTAAATTKPRGTRSFCAIISLMAAPFLEAARCRACIRSRSLTQALAAGIVNQVHRDIEHALPVFEWALLTLIARTAFKASFDNNIFAAEW